MTLALENIANYSKIFEGTLEGETILTIGGREQYRPIPPWDFPILLDNHRLAIRMEDSTASARWYLGARVDALLRTTALSETLPLATIGYFRFDARINRTIFVEIPEKSAQYRLRFEIPFWFQAVTIIVWEYIGPT